MNIPRWLVGLLGAFLTLSLPVILIASPLYIFVTPGFIRHEYGQKGFPPSERFHDAERLRLSDTILDYLRGRASLEKMASMRTDGGEIALRDEETQHLVDVKGVMDGFFLAHGIALGLALLCLVILWSSGHRSLIPRLLRQGVWITMGIIAFVVVASFVNFDLFFTRFHEIFFEANSWIFYQDDTLIQLYPLPLWQDAVWKIGAVVLLELGTVYGLSFALERLERAVR